MKFETTLSPEENIGNLELADIIDANAIRSLMDDFYALCRISVSIADLKGKVLVGVGLQDICTKFHRVHPEASRNCKESDTQLSQRIPPGEFRLYNCKNSMWKMVTPILVGDQYVGHLISGQFFFDDEVLDYDLFRSQAKRYGFDEQEYMAALDRVPRLSRKSVDTGLAFFMKLALMLSRLGYSNAKLSQTLSERDTLAKSLRESEKDLNRAQMVACTGNWRLDVRRNELLWSDETYRIFGISKGTPLTYEAFLASVHPDDREYVDKKCMGTIRGAFDIEHRIIAGDTVKYVREKAELEFDEQGALLGGFGTVQDITERKRMEENLARSKAQFEAIFNSISDAVIFADTERRIVSVNPAVTKLFGYSPEELEGKLTETIYTDRADYEELGRKRYRPNASSDKQIFEMQYRRKDGTVFDAESLGTPVRDSLGNHIGFIGIHRDVTERKRAEEALKKAYDELELRVQERTEELALTNKALRDYTTRLERLNQELEEFAWIAAHDLQEPLRKIQTFGTQLQGMQDSLNNKGQENLLRIIKSVNRMASLIRALKSYSDVSREEHSFAPADLSAVIEEAVSDLEIAIKNSEARVEFSELPSLEVDKTRMRQVFQNLISNSIKYARENEKPVVRITGHIKDGMCWIHVEDNGIGFEEQYLDRIFKPFKRLHGRDSPYEGMGMGLAICRKAVEMHGGSITARSTPGRGTTFIISLPLRHGQGLRTRGEASSCA